VTDEVQPGAKIDADVWEQFREEVRERHGVVRGHLKTELENALRQYSGNVETTDSDIERRLARIEAAVEVGATDGGADTSEPAEDTHTPTDLPDEKPHTNTGAKKKVNWLAAEYRRQYGKDNLTLHKVVHGNLKELIDEAYAFADDERTEKYIADVVDHLDMAQHPKWDHKYIPEERREEILQEEADE
jgi:hypothetical protein